MTRRAKAMKHGLPVATEALQIDGEAAVCVTVGHSPIFARACLRAWRERDGRDRRDWIQRNAFWVPSSIITRARETVEASAQAEGDQL